MESLLLYSLCIYLLIILGMAFFISKKTENEEEFLVGGRKFNLWLTTFCLFATWFGAGTLITATDEVANEGLRVTALEPYGAGACLILAGIFFAKPLWEMKLMTYADFFKIKFGARVEFLSVILNIPIYVGWIAVQIVSLANILAVFFPLPVWSLILLISLFSCIVTISGGMWSVSITDSFQLFIIVIGLIYLLFKVSGGSFESANSMISGVANQHLTWIPTEKLSDTMKWIGLFCISALGNMTGQDLGQRMFSARSAKVAKYGCILAGLGYIIIGSIPVFMGLTSSVTLGNFEGSVIPNLIKIFLDPISAVILTITIVSSVISTITSALLAPASMLSHNYLTHKFEKYSTLFLSKVGVVIVTLISVATAFAGEDVYSLLEGSYTMGFVGFFVPVTVGLYSKKLDEKACLIAIFSGILIWSPEFFGYNDFPYSLIAVVLSYPIYFLCYKFFQKS
ncbi:MAG: sodium:solute symporter family protein [Bdellovibrionales bacterium]|nr:sodium:solute symporter family protein [Bdellovibrionales bacterium]